MKVKPAFIVDGYTEKNLIDKICPNRPVRRTDLNGKSVTLDAIALRLASYIRLFNNKFYPIIIIIDKEDRTQNCSDMEDYILEKLNLMGFGDQDIRISIADKMIENWLIADLKIFDPSTCPTEVDGINAVTQIKNKLGNYNKATDCLKLLNGFSVEKAVSNSRSFKSFTEKIKNIECDFITRK